MRTVYKGSGAQHRSISENLPSLKSEYAYSNGYFGDKGKGRAFTRNIASDDPLSTAKHFFDTAGYGGIVQQMANGKGQNVKMKDGSIVSFREVSTSDGSPAVEINISKSTDAGGLKKQKIHFVKEK
ncbi:hypothetical protein [Eubacterium sp. AB3007]|uniref:hypothetical protein n=1 Tax=Eubacterium sp. AB3007 TaxID=1392487 RepID=UPI0004803BDB|nr:hypothetical protein [Eubacterium sp. AB3007]